VIAGGRESGRRIKGVEGGDYTSDDGLIRGSGLYTVRRNLPAGRGNGVARSGPSQVRLGIDMAVVLQ
jgi:hypothetical protein